MILYTVMQLELVLEGFDQTRYPLHKILYYEDVPVLVEETSGGYKRVIKVLSTNPEHYLNPRLVPGSLIKP